MAKFISSIHDRINFAVKKGLSGYFPPQKITDEVHANSLDLWGEYIKEFEKTRVMDAYLRVFQNQEIVKLNNGLANYVAQDYIYYMEGINPTGFTNTVLINGNSYVAGSTDIPLAAAGYDIGFQHWIVLNTTSYATPLTVTIKVDGVQIYTGTITNAQVIVPYLFTGQKTLTVIVVGSATLTLSLWKIATTSNNTEITWLDNTKYLYRVNHPVKAPTATYPVASNFGQQLTVLPAATFNYAVISFLKKPTKPVYAFTTSGDRYIYDDANSIDFEWHEKLHPVIMERTLSNLGINMRSEAMLAFSNQQRQIEPIAK